MGAGSCSDLSQRTAPVRTPAVADCFETRRGVGWDRVEEDLEKDHQLQTGPTSYPVAPHSLGKEKREMS